MNEYNQHAFSTTNSLVKFPQGSIIEINKRHYIVSIW